jgi:hypothetical protein
VDQLGSLLPIAWKCSRRMILESVACQKLVARAVDPDALRRSVPIRVRKSAFIPRVIGDN